MTFPLLIEVEDPALASVLRLLSKYPGVSKVHMDLDNLPGPRGTMPGLPRKKRNPELPPIQDVIIASLINGPKNNAELEAELKRVGHDGTKGQVSGTLNALRSKGITESGGPGIHKLTQMAMDKLVGAPTPALPPPARGKIKRGAPRPDALNIAHRAMLGLHPAMVSAPDLAKRLGIETKHANNDINRLREKGLVKRISKGRYGLTKKGVDNPPPPPAAEEVNHG
jgi:biotin operon repressor